MFCIIAHYFSFMALFALYFRQIKHVGLKYRAFAEYSELLHGRGAKSTHHKGTITTLI